MQTYDKSLILNYIKYKFIIHIMAPYTITITNKGVM